MNMTLNVPKLDVIHLKFVDKIGVVSMPLCEVISGECCKEDSKYVITKGDQVAALDAMQMSRLIDDAFKDVDKVEVWLIQPANEEASPLIKGFLEQFS